MKKKSLPGKTLPARKGSQTDQGREYLAEQLEPRILYSGTVAPELSNDQPVVAESAPDAVGADVPGTAIQEAQQAAADTEQFVSEGMQIEAGGTDIASDQMVMLLSFDSLSEDGEVGAISQDLANELADVASERWGASEDLTEEQENALGSLRYSVVDLEGDLLVSVAEDNTILLDIDAAGRNWFVDGTPLDDSEFGNRVSLRGFQADSGAAVAGVDVLTVLMEQQGRVIGMTDEAEREVFASGLQEGLRRIPMADEALTNPDDVSVSLVEDLASAAQERWIQSGLDAAQIEALENIEYRVVDLSTGIIGSAEDGVISIDIDAAGKGWFVDLSPEEDSEFGQQHSATSLGASESAAAKGVDLLSVILHEQGHVLGLDHVEDPAESNIMNDEFTEGERVLPTDGQADGAVAGSLEGAHHATASTIGSPPVVDGEDMASFDASSAAQGGEEYWGQTFTTGANPAGYILSAFSVVPAESNVFDGSGSIPIQISSVTGAAIASIHEETAPPVSAAAGEWVTFTLDTPVKLAPNSQYAVSVDSNRSGGSFAFSGVGNEAFSGGDFIMHAPGAVTGQFIFSPSDLTFHVDLTADNGTNNAPVAVDDGVFNNVWQLGQDNGSSGEFEQESGGSQAAPGSATARDNDYYFAGTYGIGTVAEDEAINDGIAGNTGALVGFERAITSGDPTTRIHFNLAPDQLDNEFQVVVDNVSNGGAGLSSGYEFEVHFNGNLVYIGQITTAGGSVHTTPTFSGPLVGAVTGENIITITKTDSNGGWMSFDRISLESKAVFSTDEDTELSITAPEGVLTNDTDADIDGTAPDDTLTVVSHDAQSVAGAVVTVNPNGSFTYNPAGIFDDLAEGESATDTFDYTVSDGRGELFNSDFEAGGTITSNGYTEFGTAVQQVQNSHWASDPFGTDGRGLWLRGDNANQDGGFYRDVAAVEGELVTLEANFRIEGNYVSNGGTISMHLIYLDGGGLEVSRDSLDVGASGVPTNSFVPRTITSTVPTGAVTMRSEFYWTTDSNIEVSTQTAVLIDNISLESGKSDTATVTVEVTGIDDAPILVNDDYTASNPIDEDSVLSIPADGVLANDIDPDGPNPIPFESGTFTSANGAIVTLNPDGSFSYDPTAAEILQGLDDGESLVDTFIYQVLDASTNTAADGPFSWDFGALGNLDSWSLVNGNTYFRTGNGDGVTAGDSSGGFALDSSHTNFLISSPTLRFDGTDLDGGGGTVLIVEFGGGDVDGSNNPGTVPTTAQYSDPDDVINYNGGNSNVNGHKSIAFFNVISGVYDAFVYDTSSNGGNDTFQYTAAQLQGLGVNTTTGAYQIHYFDTDSTGWGWQQLNRLEVAASTPVSSASATVSIRVNGVNDAIDAVDDNYVVSEDVALTVNTTAAGLLGNDTDADDIDLTGVNANEDAQTVTHINGTAVTDGEIVALPSGASLTINEDGTFTYTQNGIFDQLGSTERATDSFTYSVTDDDGVSTQVSSDTATVLIEIQGVNDDPTATPDSYTVDENGTLTVNAANGVLDNDTDPDANDQLAVQSTDTSASEGIFTFDTANGIDGGLLGRLIDLNNAFSEGEDVGLATPQNWLLEAPAGDELVIIQALQRLGLTPAATLIVPRIDFGVGTTTTQGDGTVLDRGGYSSSTIPPWQGLFNDLGETADMDGDQIAATFTGQIEITTAGDYDFTTRSDDGSVLYIDGELVTSLNRDGGVVNKTETVTLSAGMHDIFYGGFEGGGGAGFQASYSGADTGNVRVNIPPTVLYNDVASPGTFVSGGLKGEFFDTNNGANNNIAGSTGPYLLYGIPDDAAILLQALPSQGADQDLFTTAIDFGSDTEEATGDGTVGASSSNGNIFGGLLQANGTASNSVDNDDVAAIFEGFFNATADGDYTFNLDADNGSAIYINDGSGYQQIAAADSGTGTGTITLTAGLHPIVIGYFEDGGGAQLQATVSGPGITGTQVLGAEHLSTTDSAGGDGSFTYDPNGKFEYLAAGESATDSFEYTVTDKDGRTSTATATVTITGENDAPDIFVDTGDSAAETLIETDASQSVSGTLSVTDVDLTNVVNASFTVKSSTGNLNGIDEATLFALQTNPVVSSTENENDLTWTFDMDGNAFDYLADGETVTIVYEITVDDENGGTDTQDVTITINGTNDAPVAIDDAYTTDEDTILTVGPAATPESYAEAVRGDGPVAYYQLDADATDDQSSHDGVATNVTFGEPGIFPADNSDAANSQGAALFGGSPSRIQIEGDPAINPAGSFTVEAWAYWDGGGGYQSVITSRDTAGGLEQGYIIYKHTNGDWSFWTGVGDPGGWSAVSGGAAASDEWTHLVATFEDDGTPPDANGAYTGTQSFYVNGVLAVSESGRKYLPNTGTDVNIGSGGNAGTQYYFDGAIDEVAIYDKALTATDVANHYAVAQNTGLLTNDQDPDVDGNAPDDSITVVDFDDTSVEGGTVSVNTDGTFSYNPNGQFEYLAFGETATDSFTYTIEDESGARSTATATVTITGVNDAPVATLDTGDSAAATLVETDAPLNATGTISVTDVDTTDEVNGVVTVKSTSGNLNGIDETTLLVLQSNPVVSDAATTGDATWVFNSPAFDHLAAGEEVVLVYTLTFTDKTGGTTTQDVTINIFGTNDAPVANDDTNFANEAGGVGNASESVGGDGTELSGTSGNVLGNTGATSGDAADGDADIPDGTVDPDSVIPGEVTVSNIEYTGGSATTVGTETGGEVTGATVVDGQYGRLTINPDGTYSYELNEAATDPLGSGDAPTDEFTYTISDFGNPGLQAGFVNAANNFSLPNTGNLGVSLGPDAFWANGGSRDADREAAWGAPANKTIIYTGQVYLEVGDTHFLMMSDDSNRLTIDGTTLISDGAWNTGDAGTFTNATGEAGWFDIEIRTGNGGGGYGFFNQSAGGEPSWAGIESGFLMKSGGAASVDPSDPDWAHPEDSGDGTLFRHNVGTNTAKLTITVNGTNDVPVANNDTNSVLEDGPAATDNVLNNDTDADAADTPEVVAVNGDAGSVDTPIRLASGAEVTLNSDGTYSYDPAGAFDYLNDGESATDSFDYTISDGNYPTARYIMIQNNGPDDRRLDMGEIEVFAPGVVPAVDNAAGSGELNPTQVLPATFYERGAISDFAKSHGADSELTDGQEETGGATWGASGVGTYVIIDLGAEYEIGSVRVHQRNDGGNQDRLENFTVSLLADATGVPGAVVDSMSHPDQPETSGFGEVVFGSADSATVTITVTGQNDAPVAIDDTATVNEDGPSVDIDVFDESTATEVTLTNPTLIEGGNFAGGNEAGTLSDTFAYDPTDPTSVMPDNAYSSNGDGFHNGLTGDAILGYDLATPVTVNGDNQFVVDLYGRNSSLIRDNDIDVEFLNAAGEVIGVVTGAMISDTAPQHVRVSSFGHVGDGETIAGIRVIGHDSDGDLAGRNSFTLMEIRAAEITQDGDVDATDTIAIDSVDTTGTLGTVTIVNAANGVINYDPNGQFETLNVGQTATDSFTYTIVDDPVAGYRSDFDSSPATGSPADFRDANGYGWHYLWNAPADWDGTSSSDASTGAIGDSSNYELLFDAGSSFRVDGDTDSGNGSPGRFLNLNANGGHPGRGESQTEGAIGNSEDRYAIAAYTVGSDGNYAITDSFIQDGNSAGGGGEIKIFVNDTEVFASTYLAADALNFDSTLGALNAGDTIYVAMGPNLTDGSDGFNWDFNIRTYDTATVTVTIDGQNDAPEAKDDFALAIEAADSDGVENNVAGVDPSGNVITGGDTRSGAANDIDDADSDIDDGAVLSVTHVIFNSNEFTVSATGTTDILGDYGTLRISADGSYTYLVNQDASDSLVQGELAVDEFTYRLSDEHSATDEAKLTVTVRGVNDAPELANVGITDEAEGTQTTLSGTVTDADFNGDGYTITVDWGDPNHTEQGVYDLANLDSADGTYNAVTGEFTLFHTYLDDDPTNTPQDDYTVSVQVWETLGFELEAHYNFDDATVNDTTTNNNDGTITGALTYQNDTPAALNGGQAIDGDQSGYVTIANSASLESIDDELTMSFWIKADAADNSQWVRLIRKGDGADNGISSWMVTRHGSTSEILSRTDTYGADGVFNQNRHQTSGDDVLDGEWHHVTYTYALDPDSTSGKGITKEYIDGLLTSEAEYPHGDGLSNDGILYLLGRGGGTQSIDGSMDDIAFYSRALSASEVAQLAAGAIPTNVKSLVVDVTTTATNVDPTVTLNAVTPILENGTAELTGTFSDPGVLDSHTVTIDWDDANDEVDSIFELPAAFRIVDPETGETEINPLLAGQTFNSTTPNDTDTVLEITAVNPDGSFTFTVTHQYLDDGSSATPFGGANGTVSDIAEVSVTVTDDDNPVIASVSTLTEWVFPNFESDGSNGPGFAANDLNPDVVGGSFTESPDNVLMEVSNPGSSYATPVLRMGPVAGATNLVNAISLNSYVEFTVTPGAGQFLNLDELTFDAAKGGGGVRGWGLASSVDSFSAILGTEEIPEVRNLMPVDIDLSGEDFQGVDETITFRLYIFSPGGGSTVEFDNFQLNGTVVASDGNQTATTPVTITNVAPEVTLNAVADIDENGTATLTGEVTDPGLLDSHHVRIDWGDPNNTSDSVFNIDAIFLIDPATGQTTSVLVGKTYDSISDDAELTITSVDESSGTFEFSVERQYLDDGESESEWNPATTDVGNGTPDDTFTISVTVSDDDQRTYESLVAGDSDLTGYWRFEENDDAVTANDTSENDRDGSVTGDTEFEQDSAHDPLGNAVVFDGAGDYISTGATAGDLGFGGDFTASAWIKLDSTGLSGDSTIFGTARGSGTGTGLHLTIRNGKPHFGFLSDDTAAQTGDPALNAGEWYHVTWRFTEGSGEQAMFLNGQPYRASSGHNLFAGTGNEVEIGRWDNSDTRAFHGMIDEASVTARSMTDAEIAALYAAGPDTGGTLATATTTVKVSNVEPTVTLDPVAAINENETATLTGKITDTGRLDSQQVTIDWDDDNHTDNAVFELDAIFEVDTANGELTQILGAAGHTVFTSLDELSTLTVTGVDTDTGEISFTIDHLFLDDGESESTWDPATTPGNETASDTSNVVVTALDDDTGTGNDNEDIVVNNVAPTLTIAVTDDVIDENSEVEITGTITDTGLLDSQHLTVEWGDSNDSRLSTFDLSALLSVNTSNGTTSANLATGTINSDTDDAVLTINSVDPVNGIITFTVRNKYLDDGLSESTWNPGTTTAGNNTASDLNTITVTLVDDDSVISEGTLTNWNFGSTTPTNSAAGISVSTLDDGTGIGVYDPNFTGYPSDPVLRVGTATNDINTIDEAVDNNSYFEFTVTPDAGAQLDLSAIVFDVARGGSTTERGWGIASSLDGYATIIDSKLAPEIRPTWTSERIDLSGEQYQDLTGPVTFRIYVFSTSSGGTIEFDGLGVEGTVSQEPAIKTATVTVENVEPELTITGATDVNENNEFTLSGAITDIGLLDSHELEIDWQDPNSGDIATFDIASILAANPADGSTMANLAGTPINSSTDDSVLLIDSINTVTGIIEFRVIHTYIDDGASGTPGNDLASDPLTISVTLKDDDTGEDVKTHNLTVNNVAPTVTGLAATDAGVIDENDFTTLTGTFTDIGVADQHTVTIDWDDPNNGTDSIFTVSRTDGLTVGDTFNSADGSVLRITNINLLTGAVNFSSQHQYLDDGLAPGDGTADNISSISVTVEDDDGASAVAGFDLTVENVAPEFANLSVTPAVINENGIVTLTGNIVDPGSLDAFTLVVDWGDGQVETVALPAGSTSFSLTHQFTGNGLNNITLTLTDDDLGVATASLQVLANNVKPTVELDPVDFVKLGEPSVLTGSFTDIGLNDRHEIIIDWGDETDGRKSTFDVPPTRDLEVGDRIQSSTDGAVLVITGVNQATGEVEFRVEHTYGTDGIKNILLTVDDGDSIVTARTTATVFFILPTGTMPGIFTTQPGEASLVGILSAFRDLTEQRLFLGFRSDDAPGDRLVSGMTSDNGFGQPVIGQTTLAPFFAGVGEPGAGINIIIRDEVGNIVASQFIFADMAGNWSMSFAGLTLDDAGYTVEIQTTPPVWGSSEGMTRSALAAFNGVLISDPNALDSLSPGQIVGIILMPESIDEVIGKLTGQ